MTKNHSSITSAVKMKTAMVVAVAAGLVVAQVEFNKTDGHYHCALPNQVYCLGDSLTTNIILRCDESTVGQIGNCNDNLSGEPPMGNSYSPCWQTSNTTGDAACSKNCIVYGSSGNYNGTFTLPAEVCTPAFITATSSPATIATTSTQSVTVSSSPDSGTIFTIGTVTTTVCPESESSTASTGAVTDPSLPSLTTSTTSVTATTTMTHPTSSISSNGEVSPPPAGSTAEPSSGGPGPVVTSTSTSSVAAVPTTSFPTAGAVANHVGVGLGVMGLLVGAIL